MAILIRATCPHCGWWPEDEDLTLDAVRNHYDEAKHPHSSDAELQLEFRTYCIRCDSLLEKPTRIVNHPQYQKWYFDCPKCHRSYTLKRDPVSLPSQEGEAVEQPQSG
jgi:hypothetical protein